MRSSNDSEHPCSVSPVGLRPCRGCGDEFFFARDEDYCTYACEVATTDRELANMPALPGEKP